MTAAQTLPSFTEYTQAMDMLVTPEKGHSEGELALAREWVREYVTAVQFALDEFFGADSWSEDMFHAAMVGVRFVGGGAS